VSDSYSSRSEIAITDNDPNITSVSPGKHDEKMKKLTLKSRPLQDDFWQ